MGESWQRERHRSQLQAVRHHLLPFIWLHQTNALVFRIKTQFTYVGHEEEELEKKRQHCMYLSFISRERCALTFSADVKVVEAFNSALELLNR